MIPTATMRRALWSVVAGEARKNEFIYLWSRIANLCGIGSASARELCRDLGFDPDTGDVIRERGWEEPTC